MNKPYVMFTDMIKDQSQPEGTVATVMQNNKDYVFLNSKWEEVTSPFYIKTDKKDMEVRFMKLHPEAVAPTKANPSDLGYDLTCVAVTETPWYVEYDTGIALSYSGDFGAYVYPRSSITNKSAILGNSVGVLDPTYRGSIKLRMYHANEQRYAPGDRIGQLVFIPTLAPAMIEVAQLDSTTRGDGSFGSTGT